jgi:membrane fusion protein, multidrug efflux system
LLIPQDALVVFAGVEKVLLVKEGKAREQRVKTGLRLGNRVELLEGVAAGDIVITTPGGLADGSLVSVK